jgi:hypothetical protein
MEEKQKGNHRFHQPVRARRQADDKDKIKKIGVICETRAS